MHPMRKKAEDFNAETISMKAFGSPDSSLAIYIQQIRGIPFLSYDEQVELGRRIQRSIAEGKAQAEAAGGIIFDEAEDGNNEQDDVPEYDQPKIDSRVRKEPPGLDLDAVEKLMVSNLRWVVKIATKYKDKGLPLMDLIQEGNTGLRAAAIKYNPDREGAGTFLTYATWWIKQKISRALQSQTSTIRIPVHMQQQIRSLQKIRQELQQQGKKGTEEEIAEALDLDVERHVKTVQNAFNVRSIVSLDEPVNRDEVFPETRGDRMADTAAINAGHFAVSENEKQNVMRCVGSLEEREQYVITRRFGLDGAEPETLEEIGQYFGITRERVRQIQDKALRKMRNRMPRAEADQLDMPAFVPN